MPTHYEASMQRDLDRIRARLTAMGALCGQAVANCVKALTERNRQLAYAVIIRDQYIDAIEKEIDRLCLEFLVRQQPVATTLRFAYSTIRVNLELERIGDYSESVARQTLKLIPLDVPIPHPRYLEIAELSLAMLRDAVKAFVDRDASLAQQTIQTEDAVDQLKSNLNKDLVRLFKEQRITFDVLNPLMMITRHLERVSDQARNICVETLYVCAGEAARHPDADVIRVLFVDEHNACRSQMAEAIATQLNLPRFVFASAGRDPQPIETATREFMRTKGIDLSRTTAKAINQVPNLDHYHVVVLLAKEAKTAFPSNARNLTFLDWAIADPSKTPGTPDQVRAAYEQAYDFIHAHLRDLVGAILGNDKDQPPAAKP
ncbi:MAG: phosphate signaling complex protein PhoU [Verrucomicrobia bacterium]|nr:phosphate signaling complex protein PhoU [Verrucomicrobiota bacterium]